MLCAPSPRRGSALVALFSWTLPGVIGSSVSSANKAGSIVFSLSCVRIAFFSCLTRLLGFAARRRKAGGRGRCAWSPTLRESFPVLPAARAACSGGSVDVLPQVAEFTPSLILLRLVTATGCEVLWDACSESVDRRAGPSAACRRSGVCTLRSRAQSLWFVACVLTRHWVSGSFLFCWGLCIGVCAGGSPSVASSSCTSSSGARRCWPHAGCGRAPPPRSSRPGPACSGHGPTPLPLLLVECLLECSPFSEGRPLLFLPHLKFSGTCPGSCPGGEASFRSREAASLSVAVSTG